jgi:hypothetical protein
VKANICYFIFPEASPAFFKKQLCTVQAVGESCAACMTFFFYEAKTRILKMNLLAPPSKKNPRKVPSHQSDAQALVIIYYSAC